MMDESRYFYAPNAMETNELPDDEAMHALRVLRLKSGDTMTLTDGKGNCYKAEVTLAATRKCQYRIVEKMPQEPQWRGRLRLAVAPTKTMERIEWMVEKSTEVGIDDFLFMTCKNSERRVARTGRLEKITISAVKQSLKARKPELHSLQNFKAIISSDFPGHKFIAHCHDDGKRKNLFEEMSKPTADGSDDIIVLIGPEGDFTEEEVREAVAAGYVPVTLGKSRLRTETAGLVAAIMMHMSRELE